jgi:hypothetical protein
MSFALADRFWSMYRPRSGCGRERGRGILLRCSAAAHAPEAVVSAVTVTTA